MITAFCLANAAKANNTYTTDLEYSSSQSWSITDATQTGLDLTGDFTIMMWVNPEAHTATNYEVLASKWQSVDPNRNFIFLYWNATNPDELRLYLSSDGTNNEILSVQQNLDTSTWSHVGVTWDASDKKGKFYYNGSQTGTDQIGTYTSLFNGTGKFVIGSLNTTSNYWDGYIDDVRVYSRVLSATEISDEYDCGPNINETNLVSHWLFDNDGNDNFGSNDLTNNNSCTFQDADLPFTDSCEEETPPAITPTSTIPYESMIFSDDIGIIGHLRQYFVNDSTTTIDHEEYELYRIDFIYLFFLFFVCLSIIYLTVTILQS